jgi:hypothetical protein
MAMRVYLRVQLLSCESTAAGAFEVAVFGRTPYSPELTPSDYQLFDSNEELMESVKTWLRS